MRWVDAFVSPFFLLSSFMTFIIELCYYYAFDDHQESEKQKKRRLLFPRDSVPHLFLRDFASSFHSLCLYGR